MLTSGREVQAERPGSLPALPRRVQTLVGRRPSYAPQGAHQDIESQRGAYSRRHTPHSVCDQPNTFTAPLRSGGVVRDRCTLQP